jgi:DNA-binding transcriptional regulator YhcF (GntR family)
MNVLSVSCRDVGGYCALIQSNFKTLNKLYHYLEELDSVTSVKAFFTKLAKASSSDKS